MTGSASVLGAALLPTETFAASVGPSQTSATSNDALGQFAQLYLKTMHSPGLTVSLLSDGKISTRAFGLSDREAKAPVSTDQPFWIGSICKSFVGIVAMQLRDEGKLDLHKPVLETMPDLPIVNEFGPITPHHLLTHTSGLPNWLGLFSIDPAQRAHQQYAPGEKFAYCNLAFDLLGFLIAHLDGRSWPEAVAERIFRPLGMAGATGQIDDAVQGRMPVGYHYQYRDRPNSIVDPLIPVGYVLMSNAAGSVAATPDDMGRYMRMLTQHGQGPAGRLVSAESFELFSKPYIAAPVLSPNASYGYGIGVETIDGRKVLRHTGGTTAFGSSILVDLDSGIGAFASVNAMQGFRPNPITQFAMDLMYAAKSGKGAPAAPALADPLDCKETAPYVGPYKGAHGESITVAAEGKRLSITTPRGATSLRPLGGDQFSAADGGVLDGGSAGGQSEFAVQFEREGKGRAGAVTGINYGPYWFAGEHDSGAGGNALVENAKRYEGLYATDSPWGSALRVVQRKGKLWLNGMAEMHPNGVDGFQVGGEEGALEIKFLSFLDGRAHLLSIDGDMMRRVEGGRSA
jgi:CubicO group peptidase (beta-lactamase class C family)